jgi:hypothetical protein
MCGTEDRVMDTGRGAGLVGGRRPSFQFSPFLVQSRMRAFIQS